MLVLILLAYVNQLYKYGLYRNTYMHKQKKHPFSGLFSRTTRVSQHKEGKTILDFNEARGDGVVVASAKSSICKSFAPPSRQITMPAPHHSFFTGRILFLMPNQPCQSTEGTEYLHVFNNNRLINIYIGKKQIKHHCIYT